MCFEESKKVKKNKNSFLKIVKYALSMMIDLNFILIYIILFIFQ